MVGSRDAGPIMVDAQILDGAVCGGECNDHLFCTGVEICTVDGCISLGPPVCDDGNSCTVDTCDPGFDACLFVPVDQDQDGDGLTGCAGDCDDMNPNVRPGLAEACDGADNDCDGRVDEGALSECGDCRQGCNIVTLPDETGRSWDDITSDSNGVGTNPNGDLVLNQSRSESSFGWIANTEFATVTKLDLNTGAQIAEYDSALLDGSNGARPPGEVCVSDEDQPGQGNCPSRTAVDLRGAVYVANRAFDHQATVTKIAGREEDCEDRNGNGRIETSRDVDADGVIERDLAGEFLGQDDECILWTVDVGGPTTGIARAVAIDADGFVWVGLHGEQRVLKLDPSDGRIVLNIFLGRENFSPYGAAISGDGTLWIVEAGTGRILPINTDTGAIAGGAEVVDSRSGCTGSYGLAIDADDRVWLAGFQCRSAFRYDPVGDRWFTVDLPDSGATRGIAADDRGFIYVGASNTYLNISPFGFDVGDPIARVTRFRADDGSELQVFGTEDAPLPGLGTVGVGLDDRRRVWMINQTSGTATRFDPVTGEAREFPVGDTPYTYSDFTGFALRTFTAPNGFLRTFVEGCESGLTQWETVSWDGNIPGNTRIEIRARSANSIDALQNASWVGPFEGSPSNLSEAPGPVPSARFLELEITLISEDEETSPRLDTVDIQYNCPV